MQLPKLNFQLSKITNFGSRLILVVVIISFLASMLRIYQINLYTNINSNFKVYYNVGSILIQDWKTINQYRTKTGQFTTDYFSSLYEPQIKIEDTIWTIYRPKPQQIKYKGENWFFYISETRGYLTKNADLIPVYRKNLITGPSLNLYGQHNSIFNYSWSEFLYSYLNSKVNVDIKCSRFQQAKCPEVIDKLNIQITPSSEPNSFKLDYNYYFDNKLAKTNKQTINAFIVPENFLICPSNQYNKDSCLQPQDQNFIQRDSFPIVILDETGEKQKITMKDMGFTDFYLTNLKIDDRYNINVFEDEKINSAKDYYFVHPSGVNFRITPDDPQATLFLQKQFGSIKIVNSNCPTNYCPSGYRVTVEPK
jgi:hypothetical protein